MRLRSAGLCRNARQAKKARYFSSAMEMASMFSSGTPSSISAFSHRPPSGDAEHLHGLAHVGVNVGRGAEREKLAVEVEVHADLPLADAREVLPGRWRGPAG